jgi:hypothetical protein
MTGKRTRNVAQSVTPSLRIYVRIGALRRFDRLKRDTKELPIEVAWDRRVAERREASSDRQNDLRHGDRRQSPSFMWSNADFVVAMKSREETDSEGAVKYVSNRSMPKKAAPKKRGMAKRKRTRGAGSRNR